MLIIIMFGIFNKRYLMMSKQHIKLPENQYNGLKVEIDGNIMYITNEE